MIEVNLGDFVISLRLHGSLRNFAPPADEAEEKARHDTLTVFVAAMAKAEKVAITVLCDEMGYDEATITKIQEALAVEAEAAKVAEEKGRAEKNAGRQRARL